jgi:hypothetical protein
VTITVEQCAKFAGLASNEMVLGATPSARHRVLLSSYVLNLWRGPKTVRKMIVADIRLWLDFGMPDHAADFLIVLRQFLSDYPEARLEHWWCEDADKNKRRYKVTLGRYSTPINSLPSPTAESDRFCGIVERIDKSLCWNCYYFEKNDAVCEYLPVLRPSLQR